MKKQLLLFIFSVSVLLTGCGEAINLEEGAAPNTQLTAGVDQRNLQTPARRSPLTVGDVVPRLILRDQFNREVSTQELVLGGDALILFSPGDQSPQSRPLYDWIRKHHQDLSSKLEIVIITPDPPEINEIISARENIRVAILHDPASWASRTFGLVNSRSQMSLDQTWTVLTGKENRIFGLKPGFYELTDVLTLLAVRPTGNKDNKAVDLLFRD